MYARLREYLDSIYRRDPAARSALEILTTYPGVHALAIHRVAHWLWGVGLKWPARFLSHVGRFLTGIEIHPAARIGRHLFIDHGMGVVIGETAEIGDDCTLYHGVTLGGTTWRKEKRHPTLGNNVVVGAGAKIIGPVTVGDNARIGSNSVVTKDVPADATVVGIPARVVSIGGEPRQTERDRLAQRMGFDAYGQPSHVADPIAHAINAILDHLHLIDHKLRVLSEAFEKQGINVNFDLPKLEVSNLEEGDERSPAGSEKPGSNS
ncbi:MAG TPA: serine O-acetyltransferase [Burkholderiales bacterium]